MENSMFCYQCEQTAGGKGCTKVGVCGKTPDIACMQDLLIYQLKGISSYAMLLIEKGEKIDKDIVSFVENSLFTTLTNVNFDGDAHEKMLRKSQEIKQSLREKCGESLSDNEYASYDLSENRNQMLEDSIRAGIMFDQNLDADIRSLRQTILYGLKGMSAYSHQARALGFYSDQVDEFFFRALKAIIDDDMALEDLITFTMKTGEIAVACIQKLDEANTTTYKNPKPQKVNVKLKKGPFIVVSGHDLKDLEMILKQTEGKGINVYTHGEMIPCHGYPELNKYKHLAGNFGGAWQDQQKEFDNLPGCVLMTTNCLMKPRDSYKDRIFTTSVVGWDGLKYIGKSENGEKDFSEIIEKALELGGYNEDQEPHEILVGFGHEATLSNAPAIIDAVKSGKLKHFFLIGGCDGARPGRNYYTDFAKQVPKDCIILTLACGKYRFNKLDFGEVAGLPRLLDVGQCNDAYSAVKIALALADAFDTDVNGLPLSIILSWYEQKAVADLLALLSLGIKDIYLGPTLPAFISPNVLQYLVDTFNLNTISTPEKDLATCLGVPAQ
ncbi:hydroxylamine reductase [Metaclostridioides mangenotii]|uniref:Hydroxylamine reductase n=1 Tax=Metaclostridioides mangenotii TaxID=1540 RepID=A0ABS4EBB7_9FIRM|nr:hydroxylamine reductase [Clostridioides mangenotii]MBP1855201.1 hydroxylamine reductase [Clostridioides mangenotii]